MERSAPSQPTTSVRQGPAWNREFDELRDRHSANVQQDLADLRYLWGGSYRITWTGQFRATDIATGQTVVASTPTELRALLSTITVNSRSEADCDLP